MKKITTLVLSAALLSLLVVPAFAKPDNHKGGPWLIKVEGNGYVSGGYYNVEEADLGWNFKLNADDVVNGQLNIIEKLTDGTVRHFKLFGEDVWPVGDPAVRPILFNCDTHEVRVEGINADGQLVAAHFRGWRNTQAPNSVWYYVKQNGTYITDTGARLTVDQPFYVVCDEDEVLIETIEVPVNSGDGIDTDNSLADGHNYLIKASGTYRFANWGEYGIADAEWAYRNDSYKDNPLSLHGWTVGELTYPSVYGLDVLVNGGNMDWGDYSPEHEYSIPFTGEGATVHFSIYDSGYGDNSGFITVEIYALP